jgi:hypothetical protein
MQNNSPAAMRTANRNNQPDFHDGLNGKRYDQAVERGSKKKPIEMKFVGIGKSKQDGKRTEEVHVSNGKKVERPEEHVEHVDVPAPLIVISFVLPQMCNTRAF